MDKKATVAQSYDGWYVNIGGVEYSWNHNETDLGTKAIKEMLEDIGFIVVMDEEY